MTQPRDLQHPGAGAVIGLQNARIFEIHYDDASRAMVSPEAIPLDNSQGRADWFEFWPILNYLRMDDLEDDVFYGFL